MKNFILSIAVLLAASANAWASGAGLPQPAVVRDLLNYPSNSSLRTAQLGTQVVDKKVQVLRANYDFAVQGGSDTVAITLQDVDKKDAVLPINSVIKQVDCDIITTFTSGGSATIALGANTTTDLKAATAVATWSAGQLAGIPTGISANMVKTTAKRTILMTVAVAPLTAGKMNCFIEYYVSSL